MIIQNKTINKLHDMSYEPIRRGIFCILNKFRTDVLHMLPVTQNSY